MSELEKTYECACCLELKAETAYPFNNQGKRYLTCKDCKRLQRQICRKLERHGHRYVPSVFVGLEKERILNIFIDAGILKRSDYPWKRIKQPTETTK